MQLTLSKHRVEGLSDGIFAIVMTLLVLELKIPELERHSPNAEIVAKLREVGPQLVSFVITFLLCGVFWFQHHVSTQFIRHMTKPLIALNLGFLMGVSLLPFSGALLGRFSKAPIALQVYYGHQLVLGALLLMQWEFVVRKGLLTEGVVRRDASLLRTRLAILPVGCLVAFVTSFFQPEYAMIALLPAVAAMRLAYRLSSRSTRDS